MSEKRPLTPELYNVDPPLASEVCRLIEKRISEQEVSMVIKWSPASRVVDFEMEEDEERRATRVFAQTFAESMLGQLFPGVQISDGGVDTRYQSVEVLAASELEDDMTAHKRMSVIRIDLGRYGICTQATIAHEDEQVLQGYSFLMEPNGVAHCYRVYEVTRDELRDKVISLVDEEMAGDVLNAFYGYVPTQDYERLVDHVKQSATMMDKDELDSLLQDMADRYVARQEKFKMDQEYKMMAVEEDELQTLRLLLS